mgnify:FL=1
MYSKIVNPQTNRLVNISSKCGKLIIKKYLQKLYGGGTQTTEDPTEDVKNEEETSQGNTIEICNFTVSECPNKSYKFGETTDSSFQDICNLIKNLEINNEKLEINYNGKKYIEDNYGILPRASFVWGELSGSLGKLKEHYLKAKSEAIVIMEKMSNITDRILDEIKLPLPLIEILNNECPNIVPFKIIENRFFMIRADGSLKDSLLGGKKFSISQAEKIIMCLVDTLLCLYKKKIYYFDLKSENIGYICIDNVMSIFLIDLGSLLPIKIGEVDVYLSTYPHPIFNSYNLNYTDSLSSNYINPKLIPVCLHIYSYQLSFLFFELIGINTNLLWENINFFCGRCPALIQIKSGINSVIQTVDKHRLKSLDEDNQILIKYYNVYKDINKQLQEFKTTYDNLDDYERLALMEKPHIFTKKSLELFDLAKENNIPDFFSSFLNKK